MADSVLCWTFNSLECASNCVKLKIFSAHTHYVAYKSSGILVRSYRQETSPRFFCSFVTGVVLQYRTLYRRKIYCVCLCVHYHFFFFFCTYDVWVQCLCVKRALSKRNFSVFVKNRRCFPVGFPASFPGLKVETGFVCEFSVIV